MQFKERWEWRHGNEYSTQTPKKSTLFSGQYLCKSSTLDIGVLGYIGIVWPKEHSPEVWSVPPVTPCIIQFMCFVWIWEQTAIISLYSIMLLVQIYQTHSVNIQGVTGETDQTSGECSDITRNTYIQSWTVTEILAREKSGLLWCLLTVLVCNIILPSYLNWIPMLSLDATPATLTTGEPLRAYSGW